MPPTLNKRHGRSLSRVGSWHYLRSCMDRDIRRRSSPDEPATSRGGLKMTKGTYSRCHQYDCPGTSRWTRNIALFGGGGTRTPRHEGYSSNLIQRASLQHRISSQSTRWKQSTPIGGFKQSMNNERGTGAAHAYYSTYKHSHKERHWAVRGSKRIIDVRFRTRPRCW